MRIQALILTLFLAICTPVQAKAEQCVPYARELSGISLRGDAWRWWAAAEGQYERGRTPVIGAVMVFKPTRQMPKGHVAVVRSIVDRREIRVDHANWSSNKSGRITLNAAVVDVSAANDWSQVKVWFEQTGTMGARTNPLHGFIYPLDGKAAPRILEASARPPAATPVATKVPVAPKSAARSTATATSLNAAILAKLRGVRVEDVLKKSEQQAEQRPVRRSLG